MELPGGVSKHAFDIELVNRLPSSFRSYHGEIKYFLKAYVKRHFKIDLTSLQTINLVHFVDLNTYLPALQIKAEYSTDRVVSNFCGLNRGRIMLNAEVGKRLFLKGEIINLDINIINLSGVTVKCVFGRIMKTLTIYFDKPFLTEETFRDFVTKSRDFQGVKKYSETSYSLYIEIPPDLFVPNLRHSKLFKTTYQVQVVVKLSGCNTSMVLQFKIYLGHIPLSGIPMKPQRKGPYIRDDTTDSCTSFKL
ncbi:hypothetical protein HHI36_017641 [Cryptolaemus montrouzieri]|uniref:Arrestin C-terminal-like domain-containing protein n=1 Tax=Cryptolaemus montrouzieri TaxID=559131 RepID=A0ABD2NNH0_9CUCU